ncbi:Vacuolar protein-sorting-associated protein 33 [Coemansia sp. RSA 2711]|nr:Vacuolar protein-sorting-associated protein 33 [Coemansia sp. RSA 2711]
MAGSDSSAAEGADSSGPQILQLKEILRNELIAILDTIRGAKALVLDRDVSAALSAVVDFAVLREHGVAKMYVLDAGGAGEAEVQGVVYVVQTQVRKLRAVAAQVRAQGGREHSVQLVPRRTLLAERVLEEEGVLGSVALGEFRLDAVPLASDVVSLEQPGMFAALYADGDFGSIASVARGLMRIQGLWGVFPRLVGKGDYALALAQTLQRMRGEVGGGGALVASQAFDAAVLIDRAADVTTPLLTQLTYEGLLSETFGISDGAVAAGDGRRVGLSGDVYAAVRDASFEDVGGVLGALSRQLQRSYESRHAATTVQEIRSFVGRLGGLQTEHQALKAHVALAEALLRRTQADDFGALLDVEQTLVAGGALRGAQRAYIERVLALGDPHAHVPGVDASAHDASAPRSLHAALRVLCLCALWRGDAKALDAWRDEVVAAFGHHHAATLRSLERAGLLPRQPPPGGAAVRRALNLVAEGDDVGFAYAGYVPLAVRLLQVLAQDPAVSPASRYALLRPKAPAAGPGGGVRGGWAGWEDVLAQIPGALVDIAQVPADADARRLGAAAPATLVVFLGGCTSAEIAAVRRLSQLHAHRYIVATTEVLNGNALIDPLVQHR